jgi:uncharacterized protein YcbK (DUF882 family)
LTFSPSARLLCAALVASLALSLSGSARSAEIPTKTVLPAAAKPTGLMDNFRLRLHHLHTGEDIDVVYKDGGVYSSAGVAELNHFLRDHRTQDAADYDPREFDLLHALLTKLGKPNATIDIVCGYRTPWSNNFLRTRSAVTGVAEHSQHMLSKAIDIRIPGVSTTRLRDAALSLGMGGVGYYPTSQFVHVDVGPVRQWQFGGAPAAAHTGHRRHRA